METTENRALFDARLRPLFAPSDVIRIQLAYTLAKYHHRAQTRKELDDGGNPVRYFEHPRGVALIIIDELHIADADVIITGLLHDTFEDTDLTLEMIEFFFGKRVAQMVAMLSKKPKEGYKERLFNFADVDTLIAKCADRLHNMRTLKGSSATFIAKQLLETEEFFFPLLNHLVEMAPSHRRVAAEYLRDKIHEAVVELRKAQS